LRKLRRKLGHSILGLGVVKKKEIDRDGRRGISLSLSLSLSQLALPEGSSSCRSILSGRLGFGKRRA